MPVGLTASAAPTTIHVIAIPAPVWAATAGPAIDQALVAGPDSDMAARLVKAKKEINKGPQGVDKKRACSIFSLLAEAQGQEPKTIETAGFYQVDGGLTAGSATCKRGVHTAASYTEAGLEPSTALLLAVTRIMRLAHERAVEML